MIDRRVLVDVDRKADDLTGRLAAHPHAEGFIQPQRLPADAEKAQPGGGSRQQGEEEKSASQHGSPQERDGLYFFVSVYIFFIIGTFTMPIKQSICFPIMQPLPDPLPVFFERAAQMGFVAVEIWQRDEHFDALCELARSRGLRVASFVGHDSIASGFNDPAQHERICAELRDSIDAAARAGVPGVICFSGNVRPGQSSEAAIEACAAGLRLIAPYAEAKGVNLNMELLNSIVDHPGYQCDRSAWGLEVVRRVNSPRVKLLFDIYHMQIMEGNLIQTIHENIQWIGHFHTAGVPGRSDIDDSQEVNYRAVCKAIAEAGYDLYVGHEYKPSGELYASLRTAYQICDV